MIALSIHDQIRQLEHELRAAREAVAELERARAFALERQRQQAAVTELGSRVLASTDLQTIFDEAAQLVCDVLGTELSGVFEYDAQTRTLLLRSGVGWPKVEHFALEVIPGSQTERGLHSEVPLMVEDLATEQRFTPAPQLLAQGVRSGMSCMIPDASHVLGFIATHQRTPRRFSQDDANFLQAVANVLGHAVTRHRTLQRVTLEHALNQILVDADSLEQAAPRVLEAMARSLGAEIAELWTREGELLRRELLFVNNDAAREAALELGVELPVEDGGMIAMAWTERRPLVWTDLRHPSFARKDIARRHGLGSALAIPAVSEGRTFSVISLFSRQRLLLDPGLLQSFAQIGREFGLFVRRVRAEQRLKRSEQRYRQMFESVGVSLWEVDYSEVHAALERLRASGVEQLDTYLEARPELVHELIHQVRLLDVNHATVEMFGGRDKQELLEPLHRQFVTQSPALMRELILAVVSDQPIFQTELRIQTLDGRTLDAAFTLSFPPIAPGYRRVIASLTDIGEIKQTEAELRKTHEILSFAQRASRSGVFDWDLCADRMYWSPEYFEVHGLSAAEVEPSTAVWLASIAPEDRATARATLRHGLDDPEAHEWKIEYRIVHPRLGIRWLRGLGAIVRDEQGRPIRLTGLDIDVTETKQIEQALREADEHKDRFLAMLGHELRNPVSALRSAAEVLRLHRATAAGEVCRDRQIERAQQVISRQTQHISRLLDGLLDVSRIARNKLRLELSRVDLRERVEQLLHDRADQIAARGLTLETSLGDAPCWIEGDATRLYQIVDNLVGNAIKFTDPPGSIRVALRPGESEVELSVTDTGIGIAEDVRRHVFMPFRQAPQSIDRAEGGLGLGLAAVKGLAELHGGSVDFSSAGPGRGTTFVVRLPAGDPPKRREPSAGSSITPRSREVLIVEDNRDAADMLRELLTLLGHRARVTHDGEQALAAIREQVPELVFCDIGLPGELDGYQLARRIRADPALHEILLIALTGYGLPGDAERARLAGFDLHLRKPIDLDTIERLMAAPPERPKPRE